MADAATVEQPSKVFKTTPEMVKQLNEVNSDRFSKDFIPHYDKYDNFINKAVDELKGEGENPDGNLIKSVMLFETGMSPKKNALGFEGFPQTNEKVLKYVNRTNGTDFTMKDMYNPYKAAKYIHYYMKTTGKSDFVHNVEDSLAAYNWGIGNLIHYKKGVKEMPKQTEDYIKMYRVASSYFK